MIVQKKKIIFIATIVIVLVAAIIAALLLEIKTFKPQVEAAASQAAGMDVRINGRMGIVFTPGFAISMEDVSVRNKGTNVATIEKMTICLELIPLVRGEVRIRRVEFVRPAMSVVRYRNGTFNFDKPGPAPSEKPLSIPASSIFQGTLVFTDKLSGEKIEAERLDLTLRNVSYSGSDSAELLRNISFTGDIRCRTVKSNNLAVSNIAMKITGRRGMFDIERARMNVFGGSGKGSLHLDATGAAPRYRVFCALSRFRIADLIREFSPKNIPAKTIEGLTDFSANLTAKGKSMDEMKRSLSGDVSLKGENVTFSGANIDALVSKFKRCQNFNLVDAGAFLLAGPFGPLLTKSYNFGRLYHEESRGGEGSIKKLVAIWKVDHGIAEASDVALASNKHRIAMRGGLNLVNDRLIDTSVAVLDKRGCAVYRQKVHGPLLKPEIEASALKSITGPMSNALKSARKFIQREKCAPFYSGSVPQPAG